MKKTNSFFIKFHYLIGATLIAVGIIPIIIILFVVTNNLKNSFNIIEKEMLVSDIEKVKKVLNSELETLDQIVVDYSVWDDTYEAMINQDKEFYTENFNDWIPDNFGVDLIIASDLNNNILGTYNIVEADVPEWFDELNIMNGMADESLSRFKIKKYKDSIFLFSYSPILMSNFSGPPVGYVVLAKKITNEFLENISDKFGYDLFLTYDKQIISSFELDSTYIEDMSSELSEKDISYITYDEFIYAKTGLENLKEEEITILGIKKSRALFNGVLYLFQHNGFMSMIIIIPIYIILSYVLSRLIVAPLSKFEDELTLMTKKHKISYIESSKICEIHKLANAFNLMSSKLFDEKHENKMLKESSNRDGLTNLYNHRYFHEYVEKLIANNVKKIGLVFCDIDKFKAINDTYGHTTGDKVLVDIAKAIRLVIPKTSEVFRYGGEEFIVILVDIGEKEAFEVAENIRKYIDKNISVNEKQHYLPLTMSFGLAMYPADAITIQDLVDKADSSMYYAKQNGRNQCCRYNEPMEEFLLKNSEIFARQEVLINSAFALGAAIDVKDVYTGKHSELVTKYALLLADKLGLSSKEKQFLQIGALLHDSGKIGIPDHIINKPTKLTKDEYEIIKNHTIFGYNIVRHIVKTPSILSCVRNHHERWDGKGYPDGLEGEGIPLFARIVCIVDAFHAMISERPYRKALTVEQTFIELRTNADAQFDPNLIEVFIETIKESDSLSKSLDDGIDHYEFNQEALFMNTEF